MEDIANEIKEYILASQTENGAEFLLNKYHYIEPEYYERGLFSEYLTPANGIVFLDEEYNIEGLN